MENRPESFPELQAKFAAQCVDTMRALGINLFQCLQGERSNCWRKKYTRTYYDGQQLKFFLHGGIGLMQSELPRCLLRFLTTNDHCSHSDGAT